MMNNKNTALYVVETHSPTHNLLEDAAEYGSKGQSWSPEFVKYMVSIATHPIYSGMPDAVKTDGKIQWEAPSNRQGGQYQNSHQLRREWWHAKAQQVGIDTTTDQWISRTAKLIHPTGEKPCKRCGQILQIAYAYPNTRLMKKIQKTFGDHLDISPTETIIDIIQKAVDVLGERVITDFEKILATSSIEIPNFDSDLDAFLSWINTDYIPNEPSSLSPGVMSNAPDRFDGFHSFNKCCRGQADTGRNITNLKSYSTDRRVFEYWTEGNWIAADRLMGLIKSKFQHEACADGGSPPASADHIGPISLGFCHRPHFRLLSKAANSSKNNRMTLQDVKDLLDAESKGEKVISWYAQELWDTFKFQIDTEEKALRLSKLLRDNQRNAMVLLCTLFDHQLYLLLISLMELNQADNKVNFTNLRIANFVTVYDAIEIIPKETIYSIEQKSRRLRIGLEALRAYREKENRHLLLVDTPLIEQQVQLVVDSLEKQPPYFLTFNKAIDAVIFPKEGAISEELLRLLVQRIERYEHLEYTEQKKILQQTMSRISQKLIALWNSDRYTRFINVDDA